MGKELVDALNEAFWSGVFSRRNGNSKNCDLTTELERVIWTIGYEAADADIVRRYFDERD